MTPRATTVPSAGEMPKAMSVAAKPAIVYVVLPPTPPRRGVTGNPETCPQLTTLRRYCMVKLSMSKKRFLNRARQRWLARSFQGLFLVASAGAAGEVFLRLSVGWRWALVAVVVVAFVLGLYFARADTTNDNQED